MKFLSLLVAFSLMVPAVRANGAATPEALAREYVAAVNSKDRARQLALIHPDSLRGLTKPQMDFVDLTLSRELRRLIPDNYAVKIAPVENGKTQLDSIVAWAVKPTHQMDITFSLKENSVDAITRFLAQKDGVWFIVFAMPNAETFPLLSGQAPVKK